LQHKSQKKNHTNKKNSSCERDKKALQSVLQEEEAAPLEKKEGTDVFFLRDNKQTQTYPFTLTRIAFKM
jgi:hypothetical protein